MPSFFINSFSIPPFLLPIYQAAGAAYGIPWQVLAAINEVETDYGRDLNVSSAGAEGWMQFLPSEWGQYGVDVNDDGFEDPDNPADAIFAAARYLKAAGGDTNIRAAVFAYNHSQAYVSSVMLRARLLGGTPLELLGAVTGLTEGRFPVYAASHYSDGFPVTEGSSPHTVAGTTIYSQTGAPVIAVQDGRITQISQSGPLGLSISLQDAYGNTYTYAELGTLATLYPVLEAVESSSHAHTSASVARTGAADATRVFRAGSDNVYLHSLQVGVHVIAGTVLGHLGAGAEPHMAFQIRPAGIDAPLIDPKPILDSWVKLQSSSVLKAKGSDPFAKISPTPGQALLESKTQLEQQVPRDHSIRLATCERRLIEDGQVDRRVLAALAFLSASGLQPTVSKHSCSQGFAAEGGARSTGTVVGAVDISAVNGIRIAGAPDSDASLTAVIVHRLESLQGAMKPLQIASSTSLPGAPNSVSLPGYDGLIHVSFTSAGNANARTAAATGSGLSPAQWLALVARLGEVPDPTVSSKPSPAAIPDGSNPASQATAEGN
ncbi:MAG: lytic murein transglycosylase [Solirubrobacteraceae bacterium]